VVLAAVGAVDSDTGIDCLHGAYSWAWNAYELVVADVIAGVIADDGLGIGCAVVVPAAFVRETVLNYLQNFPVEGVDDVLMMTRFLLL